MSAFEGLVKSALEDSMLTPPKMPEITPGEASGYTVALALVALVQFGTLGQWAELAAVVSAAAVAVFTVRTTLGIRAVRHGTEQVRLEAMVHTATTPNTYDPLAADLDELDADDGGNTNAE